MITVMVATVVAASSVYHSLDIKTTLRKQFKCTEISNNWQHNTVQYKLKLQQLKKTIMHTVSHCTLVAKINASKIVLYHETVYNSIKKI